MQRRKLSQDFGGDFEPLNTAVSFVTLDGLLRGDDAAVPSPNYTRPIYSRRPERGLQLVGNLILSSNVDIRLQLLELC